MSALDLFASGMGAFILLAIMALPFFPNTGSAPEPVSGVGTGRGQPGALEDSLEIAERERDEARQPGRTAGRGTASNSRRATQHVSGARPDGTAGGKAFGTRSQNCKSRIWTW